MTVVFSHMHTYILIFSRLNEFDHRFFGLAEAEADCMDPQQKLLLQCSFRALEDSGTPMETVSGSRTGVYIGYCHHRNPMNHEHVP